MHATSKYDHLTQELEQRGPNNSILYHQRYYPEEFLGDSLHLGPPGPNGRTTVQSFGVAPPRQSSRQQAAPRQQYNAQPNYASSDEDGYGSAPAQPAYQSQPSRYQQDSYARPTSKPAPYEQPRAAARKPAATPQSYPSNSYNSYPANYPSAASSKPSASAYSPSSSSSYGAAAPASYQSAPVSQSYPSSYAPSSSSSRASAASQAPSYAPSVNYAAQPSYKKVLAASIAPVAPKSQAAPQQATYGSYPSSYSNYPSSASTAAQPSYGAAQSSPKLTSYNTAGSPYGNQARSSLVDYANLKSGVTYEEDY